MAKRKETAIVPVGNTLVLQAIDSTGLAKTLAEIGPEAADLEGLEISSADDVPMFIERAAELSRIWDAFEAERKAVVAPINAKKDEVQAEYNATLKPLKALIDGYRGKVAAFQLAEDARHRALMAQAQEAAKQRDALALRENLNAAAEAGAVKVAGASTTFGWAVKRISPDLLPREGDNWVPNLAKFEAIAKATPGDAEPPPTFGVIYEKVARVAVRR